jgi:hypothetical protein
LTPRGAPRVRMVRNYEASLLEPRRQPGEQSRVMLDRDVFNYARQYDDIENRSRHHLKHVCGQEVHACEPRESAAGNLNALGAEIERDQRATWSKPAGERLRQRVHSAPHLEYVVVGLQPARRTLAAIARCRSLIPTLTW